MTSEQDGSVYRRIDGRSRQVVIRRICVPWVIGSAPKEMCLYSDTVAFAS
jgi:hypothetical protein